jgi:hypothetical protein
MRRLIIFVMALTTLGFLVDAAAARNIVLKRTYTQGQVEIACIRGGGASIAGRGPGGFGCKTSKGEVKCNAAGECIGTCHRCGTRETGSIRDILGPSYGHKMHSTR